MSPERADQAPAARRGPAAPWVPVGPALPVPVSARPGSERARRPAPEVPAGPWVPAERPAAGRPDARPACRRRDAARLSAGLRPVVRPALPPEPADGSAAGLPAPAGQFAEPPARRVAARALRAAVPVSECREAASAARRLDRARGAGAVPRPEQRGEALPARRGRDQDRARRALGLPVSGRGRDARRAVARRHRAGPGAGDGRWAGRPPHRPEWPVRRQMAQWLPSAAWP